MSELTVRKMRVRCNKKLWWPELYGQILPSAWRVCLLVDRKPKPFPTAFARQQDAEAAKAALERNGLNTFIALAKAGRETFERTVAEAMCW